MTKPETSATLAASPPAPSVPDVVKDTQGWISHLGLRHEAYARDHELRTGRKLAQSDDGALAAFLGRMAAALTAQAAEVERLTGEAVVLRAEVGKLFDMSAANFDRATTAESSLETARGALGSCLKAMEVSQSFGGITDWTMMISDLRAALPSPPITIIKGEG